MTRALWLTLLPLAAGCAVAPQQREPAPAAVVAHSLDALESGNVAQAVKRADMSAPDSTRDGRRLLLLQALLALDPRNPNREPDIGAALAARYFAVSQDRDDQALGMFLYAVALDLGATPDSTVGLLHSIRPLASRLQELERAVARLRTELARIQETLKP
jgi:hypothetical protein